MSEKKVSVELSVHQLVLLANAINEALSAIEEWEFHARLGAFRPEAEELGRKLSGIIDSLGGPD